MIVLNERQEYFRMKSLAEWFRNIGENLLGTSCFRLLKDHISLPETENSLLPSRRLFLMEINFH